MNIIIVFIFILAAFVILWWVFSKKRTPQKPVTYTCPQCGEHHCDCYREDKAHPSDPH